MLTKYRFVKVRFEDVDKDYFAYERTRFWFFKSYLNIESSCDMWYNKMERTQTWTYTDSLEKARYKIRALLKPKNPEVTITDAETKLERHLGGVE